MLCQPAALSVAVRKLEDELGVVLFERNASEVSITPAGEKIVEQALRVLEETEVIRQLAAADKDQLTGPLRIGAIHTVGPYLFPGLIPNLHELAPQMPLFVEENYTAQLTRKLKQGQLDVIFISPPYAEAGVLTLPLYEEPFVVLLPIAHPLGAHDVIDQLQLAGDSLLLLGSSNCLRDQVIKACPDCLAGQGGEHSMQSTVEGSSLETIRRFREPVPGRQVALAWRRTFPRPQVIDVLKSAVAAGHHSCVTTLI